MRYPEHEKLKSVQALSQACGAFLDWLNENNLWVCELIDNRDEYVPTSKSTTQLLAEHFDVDLSQLEAEKRDMLERIRTE